MRIQAPHCPGCGAPLTVPEGAARADCGFCGRHLVITQERVTAPRRTDAAKAESSLPPLEEPEVTLSTHEAPRFELSFLEQQVADTVPEVFAGFELLGERFAVLALRVVDGDGRPVAQELSAAFEAAKTSLEADADPGLAANLALESLCEAPAFAHRLECLALLFEPHHMRVTAYNAGYSDAVLWGSSEAGRCITVGRAHQPLERKSLREAGDVFGNAPPVHLAATDVVVMASAGFMSRGARGYASGARVLSQTLLAHLGEAPLRVVTLVKNGFWEDFKKQRRPEQPSPIGDVKVAAVRPILPALATGLPEGVAVETVTSRRFEVAFVARPGERSRLLPLHDDRMVLVRLAVPQGEASEAQLDAVCAQVAAVLDRPKHGDNENPRAAGRKALEALGVAGARLLVVQLFDQWERVKYFRAGWKQPLGLGPRGQKGDAGQQFDEGGEATVKDGGRLFFPGGLSYEGQRPTAEALAEVWPGGKASRLYEATRAHWKTKKTPSALEGLARAALSDQPGGDLSGLCLVGTRPG